MADDHILVVDDDGGVRETLADILMAENYAVWLARNGREALDLVRGGSRPCLVLLDLMMPVMNGWEMAQEFATDPELATIPICIISAAAGRRPIPPAAVGVVNKPLEYDKLLAIIRQHC